MNSKYILQKTQGSLAQKRTEINPIKLLRDKSFSQIVAFTLAEIIIVLGIIGIVAEMTIPSLIADVQKQLYVAGLMEAHQILSNATAQILIENNSDLTNKFITESAMKDAYVSKLNIYEECTITDGGASDSCYNYNTYYNLTRTSNVGSGPFLSPGDNVLKLKNGMIMALHYYGGMAAYNSNCTGMYNECERLFIDINGFKKPNVLGRDGFWFNLLKDRIIPFDPASYCDPVSTNPYNGAGCAEKIITDGKMNY